MNSQIIDRFLLARIRTFIITGSFCFFSCHSNTATYTPAQLATVRDSVQIMAESMAKDVSREGPLAWLRYFENTPDFFMASGGQLVFPNSDSATRFIKNTLVKNITKIELRWNNIRIDPLTAKLAGLSADYHEDITWSAGNITPANGYFTAIAEQTAEGWKLRNAHWSVIAGK